MKKLILLLLFIPLVSLGQEQVQATVIKQNTTNSSFTKVENDLVLSNEKTTIKTPLAADLSNYTHLLLVDIYIYFNNGYSYGNDGSGYGSNYAGSAYNEVEASLGLTSFTIKNPYKVDKKRFKKNMTFLRTIKNESYLYLYLRQFKGKGDDINTTFIIRDSNNKIIYNATHINTGLNEILAPLIDY